MAAISHAKSETCWEINFIAKNSKWLQANFSETAEKVGKMVKILEVDANTFAQRVNKYYNERPELMDLAMKFYGAYRTLAERYDVAAGALHVATCCLAKAFPNQIPPSLSLSDEPSTPLSEPETPDILLPSPDVLPRSQSLFEPGESHKDTIGNSPNIGRKNPKGLKLVHDLFQGEPTARKGLSFEAEKIQKVKHETDMDLEVEALQRDMFHLSEETKRLNDQVLSEAERANKAEDELLTLKGNILHLSFEKDAAYNECHSYSEILANVECELAQAHSDLIRLRDVEKLSQEQKLEVELLKNKAELQVMELKLLTEKLQEVEKNKLVSIREVEKLTEQNLSSEWTIRKLHGKIGVLEETTDKLKREIHNLQKKLHEMELNLTESDEEKNCLKEKLQEAEATVSDLNTEVQMLRNEREKLMEKSELVAEKDDLLSQVVSMTAAIKSLEEKHRNLEDKNSTLSKESDLKQNQVNKLQELLSCKIVEHELHATSFQDQIEYLSEKNTGQLSEIEHLTKKLKDFEATHQLLVDQKQDLIAEKDKLFSQVQLLEEQFKAERANLEAENTMKCRNGGLRSWLNFFVVYFFPFFAPVKYHMVKYICSIRTVLYFYWIFSAVHFLSKQGISEIGSSQSKSRNNGCKIKYGIDGDFKVRQLEMENQEEILSNRKRIKKITELRQEELRGIFFLSIPIFYLHK